MRFSSVMGNSQKLDGGAMFGNAPKALWQRWAQPDERNRIGLNCRGLLVESGHHKILFETGIGAYMDPMLKDRFGVQETRHILLDSLADLGLSHEDITEIVLSHLHFDHAGGLLSQWEEGKEAQLLFPNAQIIAGAEAFQRATDPHPRDRASFIPTLNRQLAECGRLLLIEDPTEVLKLGELTLSFFISHGHTPGMLCSNLAWENKRLVFCADLIPGRHWVHVPITMGYDRYPELLIDEKEKLLKSVHQDGGLLFFTHDDRIACAALAYDGQKHRYGTQNEQPTLRRQAL